MVWLTSCRKLSPWWSVDGFLNSRVLFGLEFGGEMDQRRRTTFCGKRLFCFWRSWNRGSDLDWRDGGRGRCAGRHSHLLSPSTGPPRTLPPGPVLAKKRDFPSSTSSYRASSGWWALPFRIPGIIETPRCGIGLACSLWQSPRLMHRRSSFWASNRLLQPLPWWIRWRRGWGHERFGLAQEFGSG